MVRCIGFFGVPLGAQPEEAEGEEARDLVEALGRGHGRGAETVRHGRQSKRWFETVRPPAKVTSIQNKSSNNKHLAK
jgi:hypothetical protein